MSKLTIKFWDTSRSEYVDPINSEDFAVDDACNVFLIRTGDSMYHLEPHFYQDEERIA